MPCALATATTSCRIAAIRLLVPSKATSSCDEETQQAGVGSVQALSASFFQTSSRILSDSVVSIVGRAKRLGDGFEAVGRLAAELAEIGHADARMLDLPGAEQRAAMVGEADQHRSSPTIDAMRGALPQPFCRLSTAVSLPIIGAAALMAASVW